MRSDGGAMRPAEPPDELLKALEPGARRRLDLYHSQVWMRFFSALQDTHPYTAFALKYWHFNLLATLFFEQHPPVSADLGACGEHFAKTLQARLWRLVIASRDLKPDTSPPSLKALVARLPPQTRLCDLHAPLTTRCAWTHTLSQSRCPVQLLELALRVDQALTRSFLGADARPWKLTSSERAQILKRPLKTSPHTTLVKASWSLIQWDQTQLLADSPKPTPRPLPAPSFWVFYATPKGPSRTQVSPTMALLISQTRTASIDTLMQRLKVRMRPSEVEQFQTSLPQMVQRALSLGWWTGFSAP